MIPILQEIISDPPVLTIFLITIIIGVAAYNLDLPKPSYLKPSAFFAGIIAIVIIIDHIGSSSALDPLTRQSW